jgi:hypothetical protein
MTYVVGLFNLISGLECHLAQLSTKLRYTIKIICPPHFDENMCTKLGKIRSILRQFGSLVKFENENFLSLVETFGGNEIDDDTLLDTFRASIELPATKTFGNDRCILQGSFLYKATVNVRGSDVIETGIDPEDIANYLVSISGVLRKIGVSFPDESSIRHGLQRRGIVSESEMVAASLKDVTVDSDTHVYVFGFSEASMLASSLKSLYAFGSCISVDMGSARIHPDDFQSSVNKFKRTLDGKRNLIILDPSSRMIHKGSLGFGKEISESGIHWAGDIHLASDEQIQDSMAWTSLAVEWFIKHKLPVFIMPPHYKFVDPCCSNNKHFRGNYDPLIAFRKTIAAEEYMERWDQLLNPDGSSRVLLLKSILGKEGQLPFTLANDGNHLLPECYTKIALNLARNRHFLLKDEVSKVDITPLRHAEGGMEPVGGSFHEFFLKKSLMQTILDSRFLPA